MKALPVLSLVSYFTNREIGAAWRQIDWDCNKMVKCLKGEAINGFFEAKVGGKTRKYDDRNREDFVEVLCVTAAKKLASVVQGDFTLVPVPNSAAVRSSSADFRTLEIARRVAGRVGPRTTVIPALRWKRAMTSSRKGGTRDPQLLLDNLHLVTKPSGAVVLFDDVMTTGAHMIACCRKLKLSSVAPVLGMAIGRTTHEQRPKMIEWVNEQIGIEARPSAWDWEL